MDIIASILAYLTCISGIVGALVISFLVCFSTPDRPIATNHAVATAAAPGGPRMTAAAPGDARITTAAAAHAVPADASPANIAAVRNPKHPIIAQAAAAQTATALDVRKRSRVTSVQWRRLLQEERARRLAYQQDEDFETRFMSYAD